LPFDFEVFLLDANLRKKLQLAKKKVYFNEPQRLTQLIGANTAVIGTAVRNSVLTNIGLFKGRPRGDSFFKLQIYEKRAVCTALSNRLLSVSKIVAFALEVFR
jgi:phage gpG-like protein